MHGSMNTRSRLALGLFPWLVYFICFYFCYPWCGLPIVLLAVFPPLAATWFVNWKTALLLWLFLTPVHLLLMRAPSFQQAWLLFSRPENAAGVFLVLPLSGLAALLRRKQHHSREETRLFMTLVESIPGPVFYKNTDGIYLGCNEAFCKFLGMPRERIVGRTAFDLCPRDLAEKYQAADRRIFQNPGAQIYEAPVEYADGSRRIISFHKATFTDSQGAVKGLVGVMLDITEHKLAETALRRQEATLNAITSSAHDAILMMDPQGEISFWNPAAERILGYSAGEALGKNLHDLLAPCRYHNAQKRAFPEFAAHGTGNIVGKTVELTALRKDGLEIPVELSLSSVNLQGQWHAVGLIRDITQRRLEEQERVQNQKMTSLGRLAASLAHEINTPIQFMGDNLRFLLQAFQDIQKSVDLAAKLADLHKRKLCPENAGEEMLSQLETLDFAFLSLEIPRAQTQIMEGLERIGSLVRALKEFAQPDEDEKTCCDLNQVISNAVLISKDVWNAQAELSSELAPELPKIPCLPNSLGQVVLNLLFNASQAIAEKRPAGTEPKGRIQIASRQSGDWVEFSVHDNGVGIPPENREKIFDLFFTTKKHGVASGQGLSISRTIIHQKHQGQIRLESTPGQGSVFRVLLPLHPQQ